MKTNTIAILFSATVFWAGFVYSKGSLSGVGLALDISGAILLWRFSLPSHLIVRGVVAQTQWDVEVDKGEKHDYEFAKFVSHIGMLMILLGSILQYLGSIGGA